jgi:hypothetical protein
MRAFAVFLIAACGANRQTPAPPPPPPGTLAPIDDGRGFERAFDDARDRPRIVAALSPT